MHRKGNREKHTTSEIDPALEAAKMAAFNQKARQQASSTPTNKTRKPRK